MWMYFGNYPVNAGDGMAFVIQNDARGINAVSRASNGTVGNGQTLGVWGVDDNTSSTAAQIASRGIQNSWALEFDTYLNDNNFDLQTGRAKQHIASNYPGYSGSYASGGNFFYLKHNGLMTDSSDPSYLLSSRDYTWKHLTLEWSAAASTITYSFNDKDSATGDVIDAGTPLRADYRLDYTSGSKSWTGINAKVNLPSNLSVNYAKITYVDGKSTLLDTSQISNQSLTVLVDDLNMTNNVATISVYGSAMNTSTSTSVSVPAVTSHFNGSNALTMATTPAYTINPRNNWQLGLYFGAVGTGTTITTATTTADGVDLTGYFTFAQYNLPTSGSAVELYPTINGKVLSSVKVSDGAAREFKYHVATADLVSGMNTVTLTAGYSASTGTIYSAPITATVTVGALGFKSVSDTLSFDGTLTGGNETIAPVHQPDISVSDTRGGQNGWTIKASLTGMTANFPGTLIYQSGNGTATSLNDQAALIGTGKAADSAVDVSDDWSQSWTGGNAKGLFLKVPSSSTPGNYSGQINWELEDTPS
ncbi:lectin-like domain-containing protein [Levilactobacillus brevis]|uniref:lectin-like domain-containing protein n=1 Tax=Levilactobacillus brevis TaxID=1580 RepID=UPI0031D46F51